MTLLDKSEPQDAESAAGDGSAITARPSLLRAEVRRLTARRLVRMLLLFSTLAYLLGVGYAGVTQFGRPSAGDRAEAQRQVDRIVAEQRLWYDECLKNPRGPADVPAEEVCGPPPSENLEEQGLSTDNFLPRRQFTLSGDLPPGSIAVAVGTAALAFLIGATYIGAEWSSRSMVALLFWVPRRARVLLTKTAVLAAAALLLGVLGQVVWFLTAQILARTRGTTDVPKDFWSHQLAQQGRAVLLVVILGLLGFALANLFRHTAAALGFGFVYFVIIENLVRGLRQEWQPWLLTDNAAALVQRGGYTIYSNSGYVDEQGNYIDAGKEIVLSNLHGGLVLGGTVAAVLALGTVLFVRRDLH